MVPVGIIIIGIGSSYVPEEVKIFMVECDMSVIR